MNPSTNYMPGPADAEVRKDGEQWTLVLTRELRHAPQIVWKALTDPAQLREWAPFDADADMGTTGATVKLSTVNAPGQNVAETKITRAERPHLLEYDWGGNSMRWQLEDYGGGTRLTLWASIDRRFIAMGAAGWHLCLDVLAHLLDGAPLGRVVGMDALKSAAWQQLNAEYSRRFGVEAPSWPQKG
jgi:uncharacterized protein YndB with AHSA1/START domain